VAETKTKAEEKAKTNGKPDEEEEILEVWKLAPPRKPIRLKEGGEVYYLRSVSGMSIEEEATYDRLRRTLTRLNDKDKRTEGQEQERRQTIDALAAFVIPDAPEDEVKSAPALVKGTAIGFFISASQTTAWNVGEAIGKTMPETLRDEPEEMEEPSLEELTSDD